jgi:hypothetical protein
MSHSTAPKATDSNETALGSTVRVLCRGSATDGGEPPILWRRQAPKIVLDSASGCDPCDALVDAVIWFWPGESDLERHPDLTEDASFDLVRHVEIRGRSVAAYPFDVQPGVDPFGFTAASGVPDWEPSSENVRLGLRLPFDWPEKYREQYGQMFNPWTFRANAIVLCRYARAHGFSGPVEAVASNWWTGCSSTPTSSRVPVS